MTVRSSSPEQTRALAARMADMLLAGDIVLLRGDLGAGKTEFVRGLADGLCCSDDVSSPSFAVVNEYGGGRLSLLHLDLYRLDGVDLYDLGIDDARADAVIAIEWPERLLFPEPDAISVSIENKNSLRLITMPGDEFWAERKRSP